MVKVIYFSDALNLFTSIECFDKAIELDKTDASSLYYKRAALEALGRITEDLNSKGMALYNQSKYNEARYAFISATNLNPLDAKAWYGMSICLNAMNRTFEAKAELAKANQLGYTG